MHALSHAILTPRLRLEPMTPALALAAREGPAAFAETIGAEAPTDWCAASLRLISRAADPSWSAPPPRRAVAVHRDEGVIVGDVRFEPPQPHLRFLGEIEIGYGIAQSRRRQGYASEAAGAMIGWLFAEAGVETILAGCDKDNLASIRTLRRLGFRLDSTPGRAFWWVLQRSPHPATSA